MEWGLKEVMVESKSFTFLYLGGGFKFQIFSFFAQLFRGIDPV